MHRPALWLALSLLAAGCRPATDDVDSAVIVLVLDGVRTQESFGDGPSDAAGTEHPSELLPETWARLMPYGVRATAALNIGATVTAPSHAALVTGRRLAFGNYELEDEDPGHYRPELPSLIEALRHQQGLARQRVAVIANTVLVKPISHSLWPMDGYTHGADFGIVYDEDFEVDVPARDDAPVLEALKAQLTRDQPRFVLANLHQADRSGHYGDRGAYPSAVASLDEELAGFWEWLQAQPAYAGDTWLFVTADHGRHTDYNSDPPWKLHGDGCWGCRSVPLVVLGPGVKAGQDVDTPVLTADLGATVAALLEVELPWREGRVAGELFSQPPATTGGPDGVAEVAAAGGRLGTVRYLDEPEHRKRVEIDGIALSSPEAVAAEALAMAAADGRVWACFRELVVAPGERSEWRPRCFVDQGRGWQEIGGPADEVGPFWSATLLPDGEALDVLSPHNPFGIASFGTGDNAVGVTAARYERGEWSASTLEASVSFPGPLAAVRGEGGVQVAFSAGDGGMEARHERVVWAATLREGEGEGEPGWGPLRKADVRGLAEDALARLELPALTLGERGALRMAALIHTDELARVVLAERREDGWAPVALARPESGYVMPHLGPIWHGDRAIFAAVLDEQTSAICAAEGAAVTCAEAGPQRIQDMAADGDTLYLVADQGSADWSLLRFDLGSL